MSSIIEIGSLTGTLSISNSKLFGRLSPVNQKLNGTLSTNIITSDYTGDVETVSKPFEDQILPTANKILTNDILVKRIPIYETSNQSGGTTVYIGG